MLKLFGLVINPKLVPQNPNTLGVTAKWMASDLPGRRQTPLNFPSLPIGWAISFIKLWTQSRIILSLVWLLAPAMAMEVISLPLTLTDEWPNATLSNWKAAHDSLHLNGQRVLPLMLRQPSWNPLNYPFLPSGCLAPPRVQQSGTRFISPGKATASPLFGPIVLNNMLLTVGLVLEFLNYMPRTVGIRLRL